MGEVKYAPGEPKGTPWHPHRGFETVTYMIDGTFEHQDSNGGGGVITNGDTQWMTAGAGILHIERPPKWLVAWGGLFHGLQLWVNLPRAQKWAPPRYQDLRAGEVALLASRDGGALVRLIAGELAGHRGPGTTTTPITMVHASSSSRAPTTPERRPRRGRGGPGLGRGGRAHPATPPALRALRPYPVRRPGSARGPLRSWARPGPPVWWRGSSRRRRGRTRRPWPA